MSYSDTLVCLADEDAPDFYSWCVGNTQVAWLRQTRDGQYHWTGRIELRSGEDVDLTLGPINAEWAINIIEATLRGLGYNV